MPRRARTPTVASLIVLHFALAGCQPASFDGILAVSTNVREGSTTATPYLRVDWKKGTGVSAFEIAAAAGRDPDPVADAFASVGPAAYTLEMEPREVWTRHGQNPPAD